jgi:hypothetical protein
MISRPRALHLVTIHKVDGGDFDRGVATGEAGLSGRGVQGGDGSFHARSQGRFSEEKGTPVQTTEASIRYSIAQVFASRWGAAALEAGMLSICLRSQLSEKPVEVGWHDVEAFVVRGIGEMNRHVDLVDEDGASLTAIEVRFKRDEISAVEDIVEVLGDQFDRVGAPNAEAGWRWAAGVRHR